MLTPACGCCQKSGTVTQTHAKHTSIEKQTAFVRLLVMKNLLIKKISKNTHEMVKTFSASISNDNFVCAKNSASLQTATKPKSHTFKRNDKKGINNTRSVLTNRIGDITENIGTIIKFAKKERKFVPSLILSANGKIPTCAESEIASPSAILL